jgi:inorganic pyrophosphatase
MRCTVLGVLQTLEQTKRERRRNDRIIAVPDESHRDRQLHDVKDLLPDTWQDLEKFFAATNELEAKTLTFLGWAGLKEAQRLVRHHEKMFRKKR